MANYQNRNTPNSQDLVYWIITALLLVSIWPVGLFLLLRKVLGGKSGGSTPPGSRPGRLPALRVCPA